MGCCLSSKSPPPPPASSTTANHGGSRYDFEPPKFLKSTAESRAPPPDFDEETVKEVLSSETPNPKPPAHYSATPNPNPPPAAVNPEPEEAIVLEKKEIRPPAEVQKKEIRAEEEISISEQDASEVCSVSVSVSMSEMSTATTANDEEVVMKKKAVGANRRSPAGKMSSAAAARMNRAYSTADSGPRVVGRSPTRRSDRSPVKRNYSSGGGQVRMMGQQQGKESGGHNPAARKPLRPDPSRRDPGDSSGRRSRSPATHRSTAAAGAGGRNGSVKRANQSPGRVRKDPPEISPAASEAATKPGNGGNNNDEEDATGANESLENPLVSLECFIFL